MIPNLPLDTNPLEIPKFYRQIAENLEIRGGHHEGWHTHKRDPSVCFICDLIELAKLVTGEMEMFISKSALDLDDKYIGQELNSEGDQNIDDEGRYSSESIPEESETPRAVVTEDGQDN